MTFFVTAGMFGAMSLWGYTTGRDLTGFGSFLFMGLIGLILARWSNMFFHSSQLQFVISVIGVLIFTGLTAYDSQSIKNMYYVGDDGEMAGKKAIMGALRLYLDFINLFLYLLRFMGNRGAHSTAQSTPQTKARIVRDRAFCVVDCGAKKSPALPDLAFISARASSNFLSKIFSTCASSWPRLSTRPPAAITAYWPWLAAQAWALFHPEQGHLAGAAEDREHRRLLQEIQGIIAPFPGRDHAAIDRSECG